VRTLVRPRIRASCRQGEPIELRKETMEKLYGIMRSALSTAASGGWEAWRGTENSRKCRATTRQHAGGNKPQEVSRIFGISSKRRTKRDRSSKRRVHGYIRGWRPGELGLPKARSQHRKI